MVEKTDGTVKMAYNFWLNAILIESLFCVLCLVMSIVASGALYQYSIGLWPILFCDIVIDCHKDPEQPRNLCCFPIMIKSKWYPAVLIGIFSIFFGF